MQLSSSVNNGLVETLDRMCSSTVNTYSYKAKIADLNDALDWYFKIAFMTGMSWEFDDINQTSPPIDTQNLVSGTNRYKFSAFTEKIINLIKLEVDDSSGKGLSLIPETIDELDSTFDDLYLDPDSGTPTHYIKYGDFIYLRPSPNYNATAGLRAYFNRAISKFSFVPFTVTIANPGVFSATSHGLVAGDTVIFETDGALPTGLSVDTTYYVISAGLTANAFEVSTTAAGSAVVTSGSQSGNHAFLKTSTIPGIPLIHHQALCRKASQTYRSYPSNAGSQGTLGLLVQEILKDERDIGDYFGIRDKDVRKTLKPAQQNNK